MMNENIKINVSLGQLLWREKSKKNSPTFIVYEDILKLYVQ